MKKLLIVCALTFVACASVPPRPPAPSPTPTPTPTPPPPVTGLPEPTLLHIKPGTNQFVNASGKRVWLLGSSGICCHLDNVENGWPQISDKYLRELVSRGADLAHVRVGPYSKALEPRPEFRPYLDNGDWNPLFFSHLNATLDLAYSLGVYIEIDLLDAWALKDPRNNSWPAGSNSCAILQLAPKPVHQRLINKVVAEVGRHQNILWQISNESFVCGSTLAWELGVVDTVHIQEQASNHPRHIMATNGGIAKVDRHGDIDFVNSHQCEAPEQPGYTPKPIVTNECNPESLQNFKRQLVIAEQRGTYYNLFWSDMSTADWNSALDVILAYRKRHP